MIRLGEQPEEKAFRHARHGFGFFVFMRSPEHFVFSSLQKIKKPGTKYLAFSLLKRGLYL
jgi:hypothetical protein